MAVCRRRRLPRPQDPHWRQARSGTHAGRLRPRRPSLRSFRSATSRWPGKPHRGFLTWFNASRREARLDPLLRAAIAHFWFVTLHPFDDGNGRIARALTDLALAQGERQSIRFYAMSVAILADRKGYYRQLERAQKMREPDQPSDLTPWLHWFLATLQQAVADALAQIDRVLGKSRFWLLHRQQSLGPEQIKVLNRLLDGDRPVRGGFAGGISAAQYQAVTQVSKATATRHLADLVAKACLTRLPGGGRNTRYQIRWPAAGEVFTPE